MSTSTKAEVLANIERMKAAGWINTPPPVQLPSGNWVLTEVRVKTYGLKKNIDKNLLSLESAENALRNMGATIYNIYRSPGSTRGEDWRTDW